MPDDTLIPANDTIKDVRPHRRMAERFEVELAGGDTLLLTPDLVMQLGLRNGLALTPERRREVQRESDAVRAMDRALGLLAARARSTEELRRRLTRLAYPLEAIDRALERLTSLGYLDDADYARQVARSKALVSGQSRRRIEQELRRRGVDRTTAVEAVDATLAADDVDEDAILQRTAERRWRALGSLDPLVRRRRMYGFLARRGFDAEAIRGAIERLEGASDED